MSSIKWLSFSILACRKTKLEIKYGNLRSGQIPTNRAYTDWLINTKYFCLMADTSLRLFITSIRLRSFMGLSGTRMFPFRVRQLLSFLGPHYDTQIEITWFGHFGCCTQGLFDKLGSFTCKEYKLSNINWYDKTKLP